MTSATPINSVSSRYLAHMTDDQIRQSIKDGAADDIIERAFPGVGVNAHSIDEALDAADVNFEVAKRPIFTDVKLVGEAIEAREIQKYVATYRTDNGGTLGVVGSDYGVVQSSNAFAVLDILAKRGDLVIRSVEPINGGSKIRVSAFLGTSVIPSIDGAPNTLGHFAIFECSHDGSSSVTATIYSLRLECFNGMTSREVVKVHKVRHTSKASDRMELVTTELLTTLLGDIEAEVELFKRMTHKRMTRDQFLEFTTEFLGGELEDATKAKQTRRDNAVNELVGYFDSGNQGAGETIWGGYQSVTRWVEARKERGADAAAIAKRFESNVSGDGQRKVARALRMLTR